MPVVLRVCRLSLSLFALILTIGCKGRARTLAPAQGGVTVAPVEAPSARSALETARALADEAHRAELDAGGALLDLGSGDQHKYLQGGWAGGWGRRATDADGKSSFVEIVARAASLRLHLEEAGRPPGVVALRLRAPGGPRRFSLLVDGKVQASAEARPEWATIHLPVRDGVLGPGWRELSLVFAAGGSGPRAQVDWIWLGRQPGDQPPSLAPRVGPLGLAGDTRRALLAPDSRRYAFHLEIPPDARLLFDRGGPAGTRFLVRARRDGEPLRQLYEETAARNGWKEVELDLGGLAGGPIRLELATEGPGPAGWADPEIMVARSTRAAGGGAATARAGGPPRGVVLLVIDTARADAFRPFNPQSRVKAPAFERLAREASVFTAAYTAENWTKPSVASLLSGLYPSTHGAKREGDVLSPEIGLLPEYLREAGFATAAFIANGYVSDRFGFKRGWDHYRNYIRENRPSEAEFVFGDALAWLRAQRARRPAAPFFLYLQTIDPHVTYDVPADYLRLYHPEPYRGPLGPSLDGHEQAAISSGKRAASDADRRFIRALYDAEISYHDAHLDRFVRALADLKLLDETLLVVTNDHGEEIGDDGRYGHGHSLREEMIRSPLFMRYPARLPARRIDEVTESIDVLPTLLELLGLPAVPGLDGLSLAGLLEGRSASAPGYAVSEFLDRQRSLRVGRWKLLASASGGRRLFDLDRDPGERRDLAAQASIDRRLCEQHLGEALATPAKPARLLDQRAAQRRFKPGQVKADPELRRQLEALGYFGGLQ